MAPENPTPALILLDLMMPEMDGFEFLDTFNSRVDWRHVPVVVITAKQLTARRTRHTYRCGQLSKRAIRLIGISPPRSAKQWGAVRRVSAQGHKIVGNDFGGDVMAKILLVEDNEMNRDMLSRRLIRKGFDVVMAIDGEQAVALSQSELPDLILMDMSLPILDGWKRRAALRPPIPHPEFL